ncbi:MAG: transcriptional regulator NrdR [Planctomycetota bacterium]
MICPYCGNDEDKVIDSRASDGGLVVRRRRECVACGRRYTTYERVERTARLMVVKKDGTRVPFLVENVLGGIQAACGKRAIAEDVKEGIVRAVEEEVHRKHDREVPSTVIGRMVADRLKEADEVSYFRFMIEYDNLDTLEELAAELQHLQDRTKNLPNQQDLF